MVRFFQVKAQLLISFIPDSVPLGCSLTFRVMNLSKNPANNFLSQEYNHELLIVTTISFNHDWMLDSLMETHFRLLRVLESFKDSPLFSLAYGIIQYCENEYQYFHLIPQSLCLTSWSLLPHHQDILKTQWTHSDHSDLSIIGNYVATSNWFQSIYVPHRFYLFGSQQSHKAHISYWWWY